MRHKLIPIFVLLLAIITPFLVPKAFGAILVVSSVKVDQCTSPCSSSSFSATKDNLLLIHTLCFQSGLTVGSITDSFGDSYTQLVNIAPNGVANIWKTIISNTGSMTVTVSASGGTCTGTGAISFSAEQYSGVASIGNIASTTGIIPNTDTGSNSLSIVAQSGSSLLYDAYEAYAGNAFCNTNTPNSGQTVRQTFTCFVFGGNARFNGLTSDVLAPLTGTVNLGISFSNNCGGGGCGGNTGQFGHMIVELRPTGSPTSTSNQCIGNCYPTVNSDGTSQSLNYNFNISQTLFYLQQVSVQNAVVKNVTAVVATNYNATPTFGMTLIIGLYASNGACPNANPGTPNCPMGLVASQQFVNPKNGTVTLILNSLTVATGTWLAPAWSATRSGLNLNDTTTAQTAYLMNGIMPAFISGYVITGNIKTNIKANLISTTSGGTTSPSQTVCNNDLVCFILVAIAALTPNDLFAGGIIFLFIYTMATSAIILILISYVDRETGLKIQIPGVFFLLIFVIWTFFFWRIGALPVIVPVVEILILAVVFAGAFSGSLTSKGGSRE